YISTLVFNPSVSWLVKCTPVCAAGNNVKRGGISFPFCASSVEGLQEAKQKKGSNSRYIFLIGLGLFSNYKKESMQIHGISIDSILKQSKINPNSLGSESGWNFCSFHPCE